MWRASSSWKDNVDRFTSSITTWNRDIFGNIFQRKKRLLARLEGVNRALLNHDSLRLLTVRDNLWNEYSDTLHQEEAYWYQQSRSKWIKLGDRNTRYFHTSTISKRRHGKIEALLVKDGSWEYADGALQSMVLNFFKSLYASSNLPATRVFLTLHSFPVIDISDSLAISKPVSNEEIRYALFGMGNYKSPGPDGLHTMFFKAKWDTVGPMVTNCIREAFTNPSSIDIFNQTLITLIPKIDNPSSPVHFRPIALCNVIYKILTKVIANRLRSILPYMISANQSSFVPGRQTIDNAIVLQEVIHSMNQLHGEKGYMVIKLDLEKAFDRLEWPFMLKEHS